MYVEGDDESRNPASRRKMFGVSLELVRIRVAR